MNEFKYQLEPYKGKKHRCPQCNHEKRFVYYIDIDTNEIINETVGRCERVDSCGYHFTPSQYFDQNKVTEFDPTIFTPKKIIIKKETSFIDNSLFVESQKNTSNSFTQYLIQLFGVETTNQLIQKYRLGTYNTDKKGLTAWNNSVIFWQFDNNNQIRTGKVMQYDSKTGKRNKQLNANWIHSISTFNDFNLNQCFYATHLTISDLTSPIAIVESEKTAIIASVYFPKFIWLATGGKEFLNKEKFELLGNRKIVLFPDLNCFDHWSEKIKKLEIQNVIVSDLIETIASKADKLKGLDLADYLTDSKYSEIGYLPTVEPPKIEIKEEIKPVEVPKIQTYTKPQQNTSYRLLTPYEVSKLNLGEINPLRIDTKKIEELEQFFDNIEIPNQLKYFETTYLDLPFSIKQYLHLAKVNKNPSYINHLIKLKYYFENLI